MPEQTVLELKDAFIEGVDPEDWIIKDYLMINKSEVTLMCLTEYNEAETMQMFKEEGREEGRKEGREEKIRIFVDLVNDEILTIEEAAKRSGMTEEELKSRIAK